MADEKSITELKARIAALEMGVITDMLAQEANNPSFDPAAFAERRRNFWMAMADALNDEPGDEVFDTAFKDRMDKLGQLLVQAAKPIQEELDRRRASNQSD